MICTFGDTHRRHLVARAAARRPAPIVGTRRPLRRRRRPTWHRPPTAAAPPTPSSPARPSSRPSSASSSCSRETGELDGEPRPITHPVKFYEKGDRPLEIVTSRQWYIRNGGRDADLRDALLAPGPASCDWHPDYMRHRYENWVEGLNGDWLISRQRFFGVPIPVWYPLDADGEPDHDQPIVADEAALPVDPSSDVPARLRRGASAASPAASSATPTSWTPGPRRRSPRRSPAAGRTTPTCSPASSRWTCARRRHDIIRTWLFSTVVRAHFEHGALPWTQRRHLRLDPRPRPQEDVEVEGQRRHARSTLLEQYGADAVRYWAASGRPGTDTAFDDGPDEGRPPAGHQAAQRRRSSCSASATAADRRRRSPSRSTGRCSPRLADAGRRGHHGLRRLRLRPGPRAHRDVLLVVLRRLPRAGQGPGLRRAGRRRRRRRPRPPLRLALSTLLRLFAPFLPFVTEEVWSWWQEGSVHRAPWPDGRRAARRWPADGDPLVLAVAAEVLGEIRKAKTEAKRSLQGPVDRVVVRRPRRAAVRALRSVARRRARGRQRRRPRGRGRGRRQRSPSSWPPEPEVAAEA